MNDGQARSENIWTNVVIALLQFLTSSPMASMLTSDPNPSFWLVRLASDPDVGGILLSSSNPSNAIPFTDLVIGDR